MPVTETFYVSTETNEVISVDGNPSTYFNPEQKGKNLGKAKYIIEVFGYNHKNVAEQVRDIIDEKQMTDKLFRIRVETR
jgi:hypothetical protein